MKSPGSPVGAFLFSEVTNYLHLLAFILKQTRTIISNREIISFSTSIFGKNFKLTNPLYILFLVLALTSIITIQNLTLGEKSVLGAADSISYTHYNNYLIFSGAFHHLIDGKNLYHEYPLEYWDLFKYSPTFAFLMGAFAFFPDALGLYLWNLLNIGVFVYAIQKLPFAKSKSLFVLLFCLIELITSVQNSQSNALIVGLILLSFSEVEKKKYWLSTLCLVVTFYIKIFGILGVLLFLFYPEKRKPFLFLIFWFLILGVLPLIVISPEQLLNQYHNWFDLLLSDHAISEGISVHGMLSSWFDFDFSKYVILISGAVLLVLPIFRVKHFTELRQRLLFLSSVLLWIVIFNHKGESPTYVIAVVGATIWFLTKNSRSIYDVILLVLVFTLTVLSPTDLMPTVIRDEFINPYRLKALPCILVWIMTLFELLKHESPVLPRLPVGRQA